MCRIFLNCLYSVFLFLEYDFFYSLRYLGIIVLVSMLGKRKMFMICKGGHTILLDFVLRQWIVHSTYTPYGMISFLLFLDFFWRAMYNIMSVDTDFSCEQSKQPASITFWNLLPDRLTAKWYKDSDLTCNMVYGNQALCLLALGSFLQHKLLNT